MEKKCRVCCKEYPATKEFFYGKHDNNDGLANLCKKCNDQKASRWREKNPEKNRANHREDYQKNKDKYNAQKKEWKKNNKEKAFTSYRNHYLKHKDKILARTIKRRAQNIDQWKKCAKDLSERMKNRPDNEIPVVENKKCNRCKIVKPASEFNKSRSNKDGLYRKCRDCGKLYRIDHREQRNAYIAHKIKTNMGFRLRRNLSRYIHMAIEHKAGGKKAIKTMELLGCSIESFKKHIESQFTKGMTWDNYGYKGWHIDHIVPCAAFDLTKPEEQKKCFHYTNLQPMWGTPNIKKSSWYNGIKYTYKKS